MRAFTPVRDAGEESVVRSSPAPGCVSVEEGSARRRYTRIRLAGRRTRYRPALIGAVRRRQALALRGLRRCLALLVALIVLRNATGDDSRRRGRAGIRVAGTGAHIDTTRSAAICRTLLLTLRAVIVRHAAANVGRGRGGRAGIGEARGRAHVSRRPPPYTHRRSSPRTRTPHRPGGSTPRRLDSRCRRASRSRARPPPDRR